MKWTKEQQQAISARGGNLLVSAAAGSGKTAVITQRALDIIIKEGVDISNILMITFTDAAAIEMKSRLGARLLKEINKSKDAKKLSAQLDKINDCNISSVHAYCISLLRRNYHAAGVDPNFSVLGEDARDYMMRAMDKTIERAFDKGDKDFYDLCDTLGGRGGEKVSEIALELYDFARTQPNYIDLINTWTNNYNLGKDEILNSEWAKFLLSKLSDTINDMITLTKKAIELCLLDDGPSSYAAALDIDMLYYNQLTKASQENNLDKLRSLSSNNNYTILPRKKKTDDDTLVMMVKDIRKQTKAMDKKIATSILMLPTDEIIARHSKMYPIMCALRDVVLDFDNEYTKAKKRRRQLDFNDQLHTALQALDKAEVAKVEQDRFKYIFVDEYQDTNRLQECIIEKIISNNNLLCVGDVKQSIYSFRQADANLFLSRKAISSLDEDAANRIINLNKNFRSSPAIIDSINLVFDTVMSKRLGDIDYDDNERLYSGALRPAKDDKGSVDIAIVDCENIPIDNIDTSVEREAKVAARYIKKYMGEQIWDGKKEVMRPVKYDDICILSKSYKSHVPSVRRIIEQEGIPIMPQEAGGYFDEIEVAQIIDILTIVDNKRRDRALISTLVSPAFGYKMDELIKLRKAFEKEKLPLYECVIRYAKLDNELACRLRDFLETIDNYKDISRYISLKDFIWQVLDETGLYNAVGALPGGMYRQANLRLLLDRAQAYSKNPAASLYGFLSYISRLKKTNSQIAVESPASETAVKFMSIHKSKGLEFPIVIVINANKRPTTQDITNKLMTYKNLGYATKYYDRKARVKKKTLSTQAISAAILQSVYSEEMRVFYVALTRAKEKLLVIGSTKKGMPIQKIIDKWATPFIPSLYANDSATLLNYIGCAAIRNTFCGNIRSLVALPPEAAGQVENMKVDIIPASDITIDRTKRINAVASAMDECRQIKSTEKFIYINDNTQHAIVSKTSATAIMQGASPGTIIVPDIMPEPVFGDVSKVFTPAQKGTITHTVLEHIDFNCTDIERFVDELLQRGLLPDGAKSALHYDWIKRYLASDIVKRARKSAKVMREVPFVAKRKASEIYSHIDSDEIVLVQGIIDMCFIEDDKWVIVDYKTNRVSSKNTKEMILDHYSDQLRIYSQALEDITKIKVAQKGLYLLSTSETIWL